MTAAASQSNKDVRYGTNVKYKQIALNKIVVKFIVLFSLTAMLGRYSSWCADFSPQDNCPPDIRPPVISPPVISPPDISPPDINPPDISSPDISPPEISPPLLIRIICAYNVWQIYLVSTI